MDEVGANQVDSNQEKFEIELEFVLCLANPSYLNFLAQNEYLDKPEFIEYIEYLQYWRKPEYVRFVLFPHALHFLELLRQPAFRDAIKRSDYHFMVHTQQGWLWQHGHSLRPVPDSPTTPPPPQQETDNEKAD